MRIHTGSDAARAALEVGARAFTVGSDMVFNHGEYAPHSSAGLRLLAHELTHVVQQRGGEVQLQREPLFSDGSCGAHAQAKIARDVEIARQLVGVAVGALADPDGVAGPLARWFDIRLDMPGHREVAVDAVRDVLMRVQTLLASPIDTRCERCGARAFVNEIGNPAMGMTFCNNALSFIGATSQRQLVNTIIHEYVHMANVAHGIEDRSTKVRGLTMAQALNNAESYMKFVRAVQ